MTIIKAVEDGRQLFIGDDLSLQMRDATGPVTEGFEPRDYLPVVREWVISTTPMSPERIMGLRYLHKEKAISKETFESLGSAWFARNS